MRLALIKHKKYTKMGVFLMMYSCIRLSCIRFNVASLYFVNWLVKTPNQCLTEFFLILNILQIYIYLYMTIIINGPQTEVITV